MEFEFKSRLVKNRDSSS